MIAFEKLNFASMHCRPLSVTWRKKPCFGMLYQLTHSANNCFSVCTNHKYIVGLSDKVVNVGYLITRLMSDKRE